MRGSSGERKINKGTTMGQGHHDPPARNFVPWTKPLIHATARNLLDRHSRNGEADLSELVLVVPGGRAGRRLLEVLSATAGEEKLSLLPPAGRILTPGALPEHLYDPQLMPRPSATGAQARRAWAVALEETPEALLQTLFDPSAFAGLGGRQTLAGLLDTLNRTLGGAGHSFADVALECGKGFLFSDQERWDALAELQEVFWRVLQRAGFMDREVARRLALRDGLIRAPGPVVLIGITEMTGILREMLLAVGGRVEAFVHAPEALGDRFDSLGLIVPDAWANQAVPVFDDSLVLVDRPGDQASAVLRGLANLDGPETPEDITIGVPDEAVVPFLEQRLEAYGIPTRYAGGTPLSRTSPFRFIQAVAGYLAEGTFQAFVELIRHPVFLDRREFHVGPEEADEFFRRHYPRGFRPGDLPPEARDSRMASGVVALNGPKLLGPLAGERLLSEWMPTLLEVMAAAFGSVDHRGDPSEGRRLREALIRLRDRAQEIHEMPPALDESCQAADALRILLREVEGEAIPPEAEEEAVELVGWLEIHLDDAPVLFLTGVNEGTLPGSVNVDPFLPNSLRSRLGVADNAHRFGRDAYLLTSILQSRPGSVTLVAGRRDAGGEPLKPSRLLLSGPGPEMARRILQFSGEGGPTDSPPLPEPLDVPSAPTTGFRLPPEPVFVLSEFPRTFPVTAFRSLLADPYMWVLERQLELEEVSDQANELDPRTFGDLAHRVLEIFGRSSEAASSGISKVRRRLDGILDQVAEETFGSAPLPSVPLQVEQLRARLHSFADWQASWVEQGWRIRAVEARTTRDGGAPFAVDGNPIVLTGRIDRIDIHEETGEWVIFDYKTGERVGNPRKTHMNREGWTDLQLPLYRHLIGHLEGIRLPASPSWGETPTPGLAYLPLTRKDEAFQPAFADWTSQELMEADEVARDTVRRLREERTIRFREGVTGSGTRGSMAALLGRKVMAEEVDDSNPDSSGGDG